MFRKLAQSWHLIVLTVSLGVLAAHYPAFADCDKAQCREIQGWGQWDSVLKDNFCMSFWKDQKGLTAYSDCNQCASGQFGVECKDPDTTKKCVATDPEETVFYNDCPAG